MAAEGMWQPGQLPSLEQPMAELGLRVDPEWLTDLTAYPLNAVIGLGFCSASFVSPLGLAVTNHHCAYRSIQYNSSAESNLLEQGFLARTLGEELPAEPTQRIYVTTDISDVSEQIRAGLEGLTDGNARYALVDTRSKALVAECERGGGVRCDIYVVHGGMQFNLVRQMEIRDVRLVYAPAQAIGKFGGDVDNWIWPRHTGDFAFMRAYVGPDGKPADYAPANVPFRPKSYLKVSPQGVNPGDFAMVAGYPGRTNRYRLADEVADAIEWAYPSYRDLYRTQLDLIEQQTRERPEAAVKYASTVASLNNGLKNLQGNLDGFARLDVVSAKRAIEAEMEAWLADHPGAAPEYAARRQALEELLSSQRAMRERDKIWTALWRSGLWSSARDLYRLAVEREKPDLEREYGYQGRDEVRIRGRLDQLDKRYDAQVDRALVADLLQRYLTLGAEQRIEELDRWLGRNAETTVDLDARLDQLYGGSELADSAVRNRWFAAKAQRIEAAEDPALQLAVALMPAVLRLERAEKAFKGEEYLLRPAFMAALIAYRQSRDEAVYPDANNSLRISYGQVEGYSPRDAVSYAPQTSLSGIVEKHTGAAPFDATQRQLEAIAAQRFGRYADASLGSVPVNFLASLDITGGNSGSPVMNARAELVGLASDDNYEAMSSGWLFNPRLTRTIVVDVRYMLWIMDAVDGAHHLLREMRVKAQFGR